MPKDNESIHLPFDVPVAPSEPVGFSADQMIRCDECLRANAPTRVNCMYCGVTLPLSETTARLRKPSLRQPEKHEPGYNSILLPQKQISLDAETLAAVANLLKLDPESMQRIVSINIPLPIARTASKEEAELVFERLKECGVNTITLSDETLGFGESFLVRARTAQISEEAIQLYSAGGKDACSVAWQEFRLVVSGRILISKVEVVERMSRRTEKELIDTSQFFDDEAVLDLYSPSQDATWRVAANSFDFSCLGGDKSLIAGQNLTKLREMIAARATNAVIDDSYHELKSILELVWPTEQETQSRGWRRQGPGKYSLGAATMNSNDSQFTRYSRLRRYFVLHSTNDSPQVS